VLTTGRKRKRAAEASSLPQSEERARLEEASWPPQPDSRRSSDPGASEVVIGRFLVIASPRNSGAAICLDHPTAARRVSSGGRVRGREHQTTAVLAITAR
jgi:hypothetical protein